MVSAISRMRTRLERGALMAGGALIVALGVATIVISFGDGNLLNPGDVGSRVPGPAAQPAPVAAERLATGVEDAALEPTLATAPAPPENPGLATLPPAPTVATAPAPSSNGAPSGVSEVTVVPPATGVPPAASAAPTAGATAQVTTSSPSSVPGVAGVGTPVPATPASAAAGGRVLLDVAPQPGLAGWPSDPSSTAWLAPDGYHLFARQSQGFVGVGVWSQEPRLRDVVVSATFRKTGGPAGGGYGIIVRDQGPPPRDGLNQGGRYYVLEVGDLGQVGIWRRDEDRWAEILGWTPTAAVHPGSAENTLLVRASGPQLALWVNGMEAATSSDPVLTAGGVGVFLGGDQNQAVLTRLTIQSND